MPTQTAKIRFFKESLQAGYKRLLFAEYLTEFVWQKEAGCGDCRPCTRGVLAPVSGVRWIPVSGTLGESHWDSETGAPRKSANRTAGFEAQHARAQDRPC